MSVRVGQGLEPARAVWHEYDGDWAISCNTVEVENDDNWINVHLHHLLRHNPTLHPLGDLPVGWAAYRDQVDGPWEREAFPEDE